MEAPKKKKIIIGVVIAVLIVVASMATTIPRDIQEKKILKETVQELGKKLLVETPQQTTIKLANVGINTPTWTSCTKSGGEFDERTSACICPKTAPKNRGTDEAPSCWGTGGETADNQRKFDLNQFIDAVELYKLEFHNYPGVSACLENMSQLNKYFINNIPPVDPTGEKSFETAKCTSGYYYLYTPDVNYTLWAKMDNTANGNTNGNPEKYKNGLTTAIGGSGGIYYEEAGALLEQSDTP